MGQDNSPLMVAEEFAQIDSHGLTTMATPMLHQYVVEEHEPNRALLRPLLQWIEYHEPRSLATFLIKQTDRMWGKRFFEFATMIPPYLIRAWDSCDGPVFSMRPCSRRQCTGFIKHQCAHCGQSLARVGALALSSSFTCAGCGQYASVRNGHLTINQK
jgi:hypothetical protein